MPNVSNKLVKILKEKKTVITRVIFWKIQHHSEIDDVRIKLGRYHKPQNWGSEHLESLSPKSELTLDNEEFREFIKFLQENYEPFKKGFKDFISLDMPYNKEITEHIKVLFSHHKTKELIEYIISNQLIPAEVELGLELARRTKALIKFEEMLAENRVENDWQKWFIANEWILGSEFVRILDERGIDTSNISDFLMEAYDGFLDIIEIKRPEGSLSFWASNKDHGNYVMSSDLTKAITQASRYIYEVEREANSIKFLEKVDNVKTVKPRCVLIFGRSFNWDQEMLEAYRILNSGFHNLTILTYDHVLNRAKRILGIKN